MATIYYRYLLILFTYLIVAWAGNHSPYCHQIGALHRLLLGHHPLLQIPLRHAYPVHPGPLPHRLRLQREGDHVQGWMSLDQGGPERLGTKIRDDTRVSNDPYEKYITPL